MLATPSTLEAGGLAFQRWSRTSQPSSMPGKKWQDERLPVF